MAHHVSTTAFGTSTEKDARYLAVCKGTKNRFRYPADEPAPACSPDGHEYTVLQLERDVVEFEPKAGIDVGTLPKELRDAASRRAARVEADTGKPKEVTMTEEGLRALIASEVAKATAKSDAPKA